ARPTYAPRRGPYGPTPPTGGPPVPTGRARPPVRPPRQVSDERLDHRRVAARPAPEHRSRCGLAGPAGEHPLRLAQPPQATARPGADPAPPPRGARPRRGGAPPPPPPPPPRQVSDERLDHRRVAARPAPEHR